MGFDKAIAKVVLKVCKNIREHNGEHKVALSDGVFSNFSLTRDCIELLEKANFHVYINTALPTNDGGICLGQA